MKGLPLMVLSLAAIVLVSGCAAVSNGCASLSGEDERNECYLGLAQSTLDPEPCRKMVFEYDFNEYKKAICLEYISVKTRNIDLCDEIGTPHGPGGSGSPTYSIGRCRNRVLSELAILNNDPSFCDKIDETVLINFGSAHGYEGITDWALKAECYENVA